METSDQQHGAEKTMRALVQRSHRGPKNLVLTTDRPRALAWCCQRLLPPPAA